jgi:predicted  nucleic acid-binding Zn-ribbon protein
MNCQEVRELSSDYLDERLAPSEVLLLENHLRTCSGCYQQVDALRTTISLLGSLDEIQTSPDFLDQVQRKIEKERRLPRIWSWVFEPIKIKVPLEVSALLLLGIGVFHLYFRSPELSNEAGVPAPFQTFQTDRKRLEDKAIEKKGTKSQSHEVAKKGEVTQPDVNAKASGQASSLKPSEVISQGPQELAGAVGSRLSGETPSQASPTGSQVAGNEAEEKALDRHGRSQESDKIAEKDAVTEPQIAEGVVSSPSAPGERSREARDKIVRSARKSEVHEVVVSDVGLYEARIKALLEEMGGKLLAQEGVPESGLLLTVELPQSHQNEFLAALKEDVNTQSKLSAFRPGGAAGSIAGKAKEESQLRGALSADEKAHERNVAPAQALSLRGHESAVTLQLRILPKK